MKRQIKNAWRNFWFEYHRPLNPLIGSPMRQGYTTFRSDRLFYITAILLALTALIIAIKK